MKIHTQSTTKIIVIATSLLLVLLIGGGIAAAAITKIGPFAEQTQDEGKVNLDKPTDEQLAGGEETIEQSSPSPSTPPPSGSQTSNKSKVGVEITAANQDGDMLIVRTLIQTIESDGMCTLTLGKTGQAPITTSAKAQPTSTISTCQGFNLPVSSLAKGDWTLKINYDSNSHSGESTQAIKIQ